jgi:hypothetical protein
LRVDHKGVTVGEITKSRIAMSLIVCAALAYVIGSACGVAAFAVLSDSNLGAFTDLGHASDWLHFVGALAALVGVGAAGWELVLQKNTSEVWEVGSAALSTLLITIGTLVLASSSSSASTGNVVGAIGLGSWGLLLLSRAARRSLAEQEQPAGQTGQAKLWLTASVGLVLLAVGSGFTVGFSDQGLGIAAGVIQAFGAAALMAALTRAQSERLLVSRSMPPLVAGLAILVIAFVGKAIVAGIVFTPSGTLTELRIGGSLVTAIEMVAVAVLGYAAWLRVGDLVGSSGVPLAANTAVMEVPSPAGGVAGVATEVSGPNICASCGAPLSPGANFCPQCGTAVEAKPTA